MALIYTRAIVENSVLKFDDWDNRLQRQQNGRRVQVNTELRGKIP